MALRAQAAFPVVVVVVFLLIDRLLWICYGFDFSFVFVLALGYTLVSVSFSFTVQFYLQFL